MNSVQLCVSIANALPELFQCSPAPQEGVRVRTPLLYPDGDVVDVFVLERDGDYIVTDYGDALGWLSTQSVSARRSPRQQLLVDDICQTLGIGLNNGQLTLQARSDIALGEAVIRLAQAAVRVSDLWFTFRSRAPQTTADEVDGWLREKHIPFERAVRQPGRSGREWTVDFRTQADDRASLVFLLSTGSRGAARRITEHALTRCVDLSHLKASQPHLAFVSLFDDTEGVWEEENFRLMEDHSEIALWSRPDEFERILIRS